MLEIFLIMIGLFIPLGMMAHKRKRSSGSFRAVPFSIQLATGALGAETVIKVDVFASNSTRDSWITSIDYTASIRDHTAGEGPLQIGFAHDDYTVAEIKECLESGASFDPGNKIAQEQSRRLVRAAGIFSGAAAFESLYDGRPKRRKIGFLVSQGFNLAFWIKNNDGAALTGGGIVEISGTAYMRQS